MLRQPGTAEQSSTYLVEYHDELINRLRVQEYEAARAAADAAGARATHDEATASAAAVRLAAVEAGAAGNALAPEVASRLTESDKTLTASAAAVASATEEARYRMLALTEWRDFIREPLRRTREEMRRRRMLLPDLPPDIELGEDYA